MFGEVPPELTSIISTPLFFNSLHKLIESFKPQPFLIQSVYEILKDRIFSFGQTDLIASATSKHKRILPIVFFPYLSLRLFEIGL